MNHVLLVDDEPNVLAGLQRKLHSEREFFVCETVDSGKAALKRIDQGGIDVIVSDVKMPGMDGIDLLTRLKADPASQHIPVIMLTGVADADSRRLALQLGAYDFVSKPADPHELAARLRNAMRLKAYQDRLRAQNETLEQQVFQLQKLEIIGILAAGVAHDLGNILGSIGGHAELAAHDIRPGSKAWDHLQSVQRSVDHAAKMSRQILTLGQRTEQARQTCDLRSIVDDCLRMLGASLTPDVTVIWNSPETMMVWSADPTQIRQVIMNLCINAIQAMDSAGRLQIDVAEKELDGEAAAEIGEITGGRYLTLTIADTGKGMDAETLAKVFEPFFTTKGEGRGTGLGLSVADKIVRNHGGRITVTSALGRGTTFNIYFPVQAEKPREPGSKETGVHDAREEAHSIR
jgi:signal transduction histidine kinase